MKLRLRFTYWEKHWSVLLHDFEVDYSKEHKVDIIGDDAHDVTGKYLQILHNHDVHKYTPLTFLAVEDVH